MSSSLPDNEEDFMRTADSKGTRFFGVLTKNIVRTPHWVYHFRTKACLKGHFGSSSFGGTEHG